MLEAAARKFGGLAAPPPAEQKAFLALPFREARMTPAYLLAREGEVSTRCYVLLNSYACRQKVTKGGKRQILSFHMSGDILDLHHLKLPVADHNVEAITPVHVVICSPETGSLDVRVFC